jgi:hypothetical protein
MGLGSGIQDPGYGIQDPGSGIRDPGSGINLFRIRDPGSGSRGQKCIGAGSRIRNTAFFSPNERKKVEININWMFVVQLFPGAHPTHSELSFPSIPSSQTTRKLKQRRR